MKRKIQSANIGYLARGFITEDEFDFVDSLSNAVFNESFDSENIADYSDYWENLEKNDYDGIVSAIFLSILFHSHDYWTEEEVNGLSRILAADALGAYASVFWEIGTNWGCNCWNGAEGQQRIGRAALSGAVQGSATRGFLRVFGL
ncbi:MAG: hypothetical protein SH848_02580 [Saprospiraceae bacterium]|nr:hypothetical protein [Saprospiraceae bacterium]MDZ4702786.1 hypothetical protein [Saprospiraceae bacterium]